MKKYSIIVAILAIGFLFAIAYAQMEKQQAAKMNPEAELQKSIEQGKKLFMNASLGTSGMSCNSCHIEGGTKDNKMGKMMMKAFDNLGAKYPRYFMMGKKVATLDQVVNMCIMGPMKGKPLSWNDQKLTNLVAFVASVKAKK